MKTLAPAEVGRIAKVVLDQVGTVVVGKRDSLELVLAGILAGGHVLLEDLPGPGQDADRAVVRAGARPGLPPAAVHPRPAARRRDRLVPLRPAHRTTSPSGPGRSSPTCCSPTRSTAPRRRPSRRCWRRCRSGRSRSRAPPTGWTRRSTCSPPPTRSSTRAPTRCPRPSSTASCSASRSATRQPTRSGRCCAAGWPAGRRRPLLEPVVDAETLLAMQARPGGRQRGGLDRPLHRRRSPRRPARTRRSSSAPPPAARSRCCCSPGPRAALDGRDYVIPEDVKAVAVPALAHRITLLPGDVAQAHRPAGPWWARCSRRPRPRPAARCPPTAEGVAERRPSPTAGAGRRSHARAFEPTRALGRAVLRRRGARLRRRPQRAVRPGCARHPVRRRHRAVPGAPPRPRADGRGHHGRAVRGRGRRARRQHRRRQPRPAAASTWSWSGWRCPAGSAWSTATARMSSPSTPAPSPASTCTAGRCAGAATRSAPSPRTASPPTACSSAGPCRHPRCRSRPTRRSSTSTPPRPCPARPGTGRRPPLPPPGRRRRARRGPPLRLRRPAAPHRLAGLPAHPRAARRQHPVRP